MARPFVFTCQTARSFRCHKNAQSSAGPADDRARASTHLVVSFFLLAHARRLPPQGDGAPRRRCHKGHASARPARRAWRAHSQRRVHASRRSIAAMFSVPGRATGGSRSACADPSLRTDRKPVLVPVGGSPGRPGAFVAFPRRPAGAAVPAPPPDDSGITTPLKWSGNGAAFSAPAAKKGRRRRAEPRKNFPRRYPQKCTN